MRLRRFLLPTVAALVASAAVAASASADAVDAPSVEIGPSPTLFAPGNNVFFASGSGDGTTALGSIQFSEFGTYQGIFGTIACLNVVGNRGVVIYRNSPTQPFKTPGGIILIEDIGTGYYSGDKQKNGRLGKPAFDRHLANGCPLPNPWPSLNTINFGDITLTDTPAAAM
jgi:hypothetical protein